MTLVLTWANRNYAVQVSDRRLTRADGSLFADHRTKCVLYCNRVAISYTGPAEMEREDTATWLGKILARFTNLETGLEEVAARATNAVRRYEPRSRPFAVAAVGWATLRGEGPPRAFIASVSNSLAPDGSWLKRPLPRASLRVRMIERGEPFLSMELGQFLLPSERAFLGAESAWR